MHNTNLKRYAEKLYYLSIMIVALLVGSSCKPPPGQISIRVNTDMQQGPDKTLAAIRIEVMGAASGTVYYQNQFPLRDQLSSMFTTLPADLAVTYTGGDRIMVARVVAVGRTERGYGDLFDVRLIAPFPRDRLGVADVFLANRCLLAENRRCPEGYSCGRFGCEPQTRGELPGITADAEMDVNAVPPLPPEDGSAQEMDSSMDSSMDAGMDSSMDVAVEAAIDGSVDAGARVDGDAGDGRPMCVGSQMLCGSTCIDTATSSDNCGACGRRCADLPGVSSAVCIAGMCANVVCAPDRGDCDGLPNNGCEADLTSSRTCGNCGTACSGATPICGLRGAFRACGNGCGIGQTLCGMSCVDLQISALNCGACGNSCGNPANGTASCAAGGCTVTCDRGFANCDGNLANGCEVQLDSNSMHCGACGRMCPGLPNGQNVCSASTCNLICNAGFGNCDMNAANGCERPLNNDVNNCGACNNRCPMRANANATCTMGSCGFVCQPGFADCDRNPLNGCEVDITTAANCGVCGRMCGGATPLCNAMNGQCVSNCAAPAMMCGGGCANISTDPTNCGMCDNVCPPVMGGNAICSGGACGFTCSMPFADCNLFDLDGCEIDTSSDYENCGACRLVCPGAANATATCTGGSCGISCDFGYANCNANPGDGCEVFTTLDVNNCGACGNRCPMRAHSMPSCLMGMCGFVCDDGWSDSNLDPSDGCETFAGGGGCVMPGDFCLSPDLNPCRQYYCAGMPLTCNSFNPIREGLSCAYGGVDDGYCLRGNCIPNGVDGGADLVDGPQGDSVN